MLKYSSRLLVVGLMTTETFERMGDDVACLEFDDDDHDDAASSPLVLVSPVKKAVFQRGKGNKASPSIEEMDDEGSTTDGGGSSITR